METESEYRKERAALVAVVVLASVAVASLLVAFSYYCYIRNKVSLRLKSHASEPHFTLSYKDCADVSLKFMKICFFFSFKA